ncbi:btaf1 RNA polymerase II, B-TFIID transcription factor-associated, 170kDa [Spiromyces aspiralis]|uniref:Btaf1 RNA polymerase II, B-TFIID transcription factor-associated, 170kDa n=1 Tax=Spiromyces aspiralis TaxID=68401 RepID=A0ACC1HEI2_9FUNG|nr:btaf1 RNA polymerase II, B-TFIID transcription factor-associated, 170kDa [Spiromyces aspiralis]
MVLTPKHPRYTEIMTSLAQRGVDLSDISLAPKLLALRELLCECGIGTLGAVTAAAGGGGSNSSSSSRYSAGGSDVAVAVEEAAALASANHRALVFCQHKEMLDRIQSDLLDREMPGVSYLRFDGSVPAQKRQSIVNQFNSDPSIDLLLLTTHVGGLGLNLTSADTVIFVEHDWNPMMDRQAMDRAHRLGQTRVVNVYRLITRGTLEEKIMGLQNFKMNMANAIINQQNSGIGSMNTDELLDLFTPASTSAVAESKRRSVHGENNKGQTTAKAAIEGLGELWDATQYEEEYNLDNFLESLHS